MRERLIELIEQAQSGGWKFVGDGYTSDILNFELADHLLKNGVIVPPCKVGDTVYYPSHYKSGIIEGKILRIIVNKNGISLFAKYRALTANDFGKSVFFTREDAEKALEEMNNGKLDGGEE